MTPRHLYVHVPFCARRCIYCDFSIAVRRTVPIEEFLDALVLELEHRSEHGSANSSPLETVYFGGGTPSRLGGDGVARMVAIVNQFHSIAAAPEITLEANPDDVSAQNAERWATAGINRISLGVQTFDDSTLAWMHRTHSAAQARAAVAIARCAGIQNISVDLIFALPGGLNRSWRDDLDEALALEPDHISLYGLTIERGTPLARLTASGAAALAGEDTYAEEFLLAHATAEAAGFEHYEVSNFARTGRRSRHNSAYWTGAQYLGIGPSAHSFDGERRSWNVSPYAAWVSRLAGGSSPEEGGEILSASNRSAESIYLGLRTAEGYRAEAADLDIARSWAGAGWAAIDDERVRLTPEGWLRLDSLAAGLTGF